MTKAKIGKTSILKCVLLVGLLGILPTLPLAYSIPQGLIAPAVHAFAEDGGTVFEIPPEGLVYELIKDSGGFVPVQCLSVAGINMAWATAEIPADTESVSVKIPSEYSFADEIYPVNSISEHAFHCFYNVNGSDKNYKYITSDKSIFSGTYALSDLETARFTISKVDFSESYNLTRIRKAAFMNGSFSTLDLSDTGGKDDSYEMFGISSLALYIAERAFYGCKQLETVVFPRSMILSVEPFAFSYCSGLEILDLSPPLSVTLGGYSFFECAKLNTVYLGGKDEEWETAYGIETANSDDTPFDETGSLNLIVPSKEDCTDEDNTYIERYRSKMTYEYEVTFKTAENAIHETQIKLFNRPLDYIKQDNGAWKHDSSYRLPAPDCGEGYFCKWTDGAAFFREDDNVTAAQLTAVAQYGLDAQYYLPPGKLIYTNAKLDDLKQYLTVRAYTAAYSSAVTEDYTLGFASGKTGFSPGENTIRILCGNCVLSIVVDITTVPYEPPPKSGLTAWEIAGIAIGAAALPAGLLALYLLWRRKRRAVSVPAGKRFGNAEQTFTPVTPTLPDTLTLRERETAMLMLNGKRRKDIAALLFVSEATAKAHIEKVLHKTGCANHLEFLLRYEGKLTNNL